MKNALYSLIFVTTCFAPLSCIAQTDRSLAKIPTEISPAYQDIGKEGNSWIKDHNNYFFAATIFVFVAAYYLDMRFRRGSV